MGSGKTYPNTWDGVMEAAKDAGAKWPALVAAQWALESGWGKHTPAGARFNSFGLKGGNDTTSETQEFVGGKWITISAEFIDFPDLFSYVDYLVSHWHRGFGGFQRVSAIAGASMKLQKSCYGRGIEWTKRKCDISRSNW